MKFRTRFVLYAVTTAALVLVVTPLAQAQIPGLGPYNGPTAERTRDESDRDLEDRIAYQRLLANLYANRRNRKKPDLKLAAAQLQEDFTRLQVLNKKLVLTTARSTDLDLKFIAKSASEIHKRAERLMSNLALPDPENAPQRPELKDISDSKQMKSSITALGWLIYDFTKNPIFKEASVVETQPAAKARRDLEAVIELSERIKKSSGRMK